MASYQSHYDVQRLLDLAGGRARAALTDLDSARGGSVADMLAHYAGDGRSWWRASGRSGGVRRHAGGRLLRVRRRLGALPREGDRGVGAFCDRLLSEAHVAAVPGDAFGEDSCVRFSFATDPARIDEGRAADRRLGRVPLAGRRAGQEEAIATPTPAVRRQGFPRAGLEEFDVRAPGRHARGRAQPQDADLQEHQQGDRGPRNRSHAPCRPRRGRGPPRLRGRTRRPRVRGPRIQDPESARRANR